LALTQHVEPAASISRSTCFSIRYSRDDSFTVAYYCWSGETPKDNCGLASATRHYRQRCWLPPNKRAGNIWLPSQFRRGLASPLTRETLRRHRVHWKRDDFRSMVAAGRARSRSRFRRSKVTMRYGIRSIRVTIRLRAWWGSSVRPTVLSW
jgi:hypothetical protein